MKLCPFLLFFPALLSISAFATQTITAKMEIDATLSLGPLKPLHRDFAQGGESSDADYLEGLIGEMRALRPRIVRFDHALDHLVPGPDGEEYVYDYSRFNKKVSVIREMGAEPLVSLSYVPLVISSSDSNTHPPRDLEEWGGIIRDFVTQANQDPKRRIRYWEVWNEPDHGSFWQGTMEEFLDLFEVTVKAALDADPTLSIGGPAFAGFPETWLDALLDRVVEKGLRLDFLSWHLYHVAPSEYARTTSLALRKLEERGLKAELILDEWNYHAGLPAENDTHVGAAYIAEALTAMQDTPLDYAPFFEIRDGWNPEGNEFWGRWGLFTCGMLPKANYFCFLAFSRLGPERISLVTDFPGIGGIASRDGDRTLTVLYNRNHEPIQLEIGLRLQESPIPGILSRWLVDESHSNPAMRLFHENRPWELEKVERVTLYPEPDGVFRYPILLPPQSVSLVEWRPEFQPLDVRPESPKSNIVFGNGDPVEIEIPLKNTTGRETVHVFSEVRGDKLHALIENGILHIEYDPEPWEKDSWRFLQAEIRRNERSARLTIPCHVRARTALKVPMRVAFFTDTHRALIPFLAENDSDRIIRGRYNWNAPGPLVVAPDSGEFSVDPNGRTGLEFSAQVPEDTSRHVYPGWIHWHMESGNRITHRLAVCRGFPAGKDEWMTTRMVAAKFTSSEEPPVSPVDEIGVMGAKWDERGLDLAVSVRDNLHVQNATPEWMWTGDSIQIAFSMTLDAREGVPYGDNDYEFGVALSKDEETMIWCWHRGGREPGIPEGFYAHVTREEETTRYFVRIPWETLAPFVPEAGKGFGFSLLVNDNNGTGRRWSHLGANIAEHKQPDQFPMMVLLPKNDGEEPHANGNPE